MTIYVSYNSCTVLNDLHPLRVMNYLFRPRCEGRGPNVTPFPFTERFRRSHYAQPISDVQTSAGERRSASPEFSCEDRINHEASALHQQRKVQAFFFHPAADLVVP